MAKVGDRLPQPEQGWKRYDDTDTRFTYRGFDTHKEDSESYNETYAGAISAENPEIEFTFIGSKIRIIATVSSTYSQDVQIIIDGNVESFSAYRSSMQRQTLVYHKEGLEFKEHHVLIRTNTPASNVVTYDYRFDAIDIDDTGYLTPVVIGEEILLHPMIGWKRYNDNHPAIKYQEGKWRYVQAANNYNGDYTGAYKNTEAEVEFCFVGKGLSLTGLQGFGYADNVEVYIDGEFKGTVEVYHPVDRYNRLLYLIDDLEDKKHHVAIKVRVKTPNPKAITYDMRLDAIDILSDREDGGILLHPDEVLDIKDLDIGKRIRCHYTATNNQVGVFSNLGKEVYVDGINDFIPPTSSATPNGCFYFICVDKDHLGRWKLIADRNIQHSISWDALNSAGIASGSGINYSLNDQGATIRLLTGGVSSTDKDNEWDKYIVNSDLNGTIQAGDNHVWNWNVSTYSWTSTTPSGTNSDRRVLRGYNSLTGWSNVASNNATNQRGFRPVLLLDSEIQKILLKDNITGSYYYYDNDWKSLGVPENNDELNTWLSEYGMEKINGQHLLTFKQNIGNKVKFVFKLEK